MLLVLLSFAMPPLRAALYLFMTFLLALVAFALLSFASPHMPLSQTVEKSRQARQIGLIMLLGISMAALVAIREDVRSAAVTARLWDEAEALARGADPGDLNQALMELGATLCTPRAPHCEACPVAALTEKKSRYQIRPWEARHVRTTCHFCGVGCQMDLHIKDDKIMKVTAVEDALPNQGMLCVKGRFGYDFLQSPERLIQPMIRENGELRNSSWEEALDLISSKIKETKEKEGPEAIAGVSSAKSTNEALYLMQKLFRTAIGSNNLASPSAANGLNNPIVKLEQAKGIILIGCDVTEDNPVAGAYIKRAAKNGCQLIVIDSRPTKIGAFAALNLVVKEGTESVLVNGFIQQLLERGREGSEEVKSTAANYPLSTVIKTTGLSTEEITSAVDMLDTDEPAMLVYGSSVAPFAGAFVQLQEILGNLDKTGGGLNYLGELNNSHGACDMGLLPGYLPGYAPVDDDGARKVFEDVWDCSLNNTVGLGFSDIVRNLGGAGGDKEKRISLLYLAGENLSIAGSGIPGIAKALESVDFLVVQDILNHETVQHADVVLPAAAWAEDEGTYTNCERRVSLMRQAVTPPGEAKPETWIFTELARRLGQDWPEASSREIWENEIASLLPQFRGITYERIDGMGLQWPVPDSTSMGTPSLNGDRPPLVKPAEIPMPRDRQPKGIDSELSVYQPIMVESTA